MRTIWKFPFNVADRFDLRMPSVGNVLSVQVQGGQPCIWAMVDDSAPRVLKQFAVKGTGHPCDDLPPLARHHGTFQLHGGALVFHLFEIPQYSPC